MKKSFLQKYADVMPEGAGALFFIQMFAALAFSVLYSTLVLYATNWLKLSDTATTGIVASFIAFNYALHLLGGYVGGRFFSYRSLFSIGMVFSIIGCLLISIPTLKCLYWGLAFFLTGAGLNITCINCMMTQLFQPNDHRREAAFLWNYSGMNVGFLVGFSLSGYFQLTHNYHELFILSSAGSLIALIITFFTWKKLSDINTVFADLHANERLPANIKGIFCVIALLLILRIVIENAKLSNQLVMIMGAIMGCIITLLAFKQRHAEARNKMLGYIILSLTALIFWTLYQLAPMGLTLFIERNVDLHYLGMTIAPQWVLNINTVVIIIGGPLLSIIFSKLRAKGYHISIPLQFSIALILIGISFAILPLGIHFANWRGLTNFNWILISYILQSAGELFISPIGYAMVGKLAPARLQGLMMGTWMMLTGIGATLSGYFSEKALGTSHSTNPLITNASFSHTFNLLGWIAMGVGVSLFILLPLVLRLTKEKELITHRETTMPH